MRAEHTYSMRLVRPFLRLLRRRPEVPDVLLEALDGHDDDVRLPVTALHELLRGAIVLTGEPNLGLLAAAEIEAGDYGTMEYAASSARDVAAALQVIGRYMRLINDAVSFSVETEGGRAAVRLQHAVEMPSWAEDFELAAFSAAFARRLGGALSFPVTLHFTHAAPDDLTPYRAAFADDAALEFAAQATGFSFDTGHLADHLPTADPKLHAVISQHADHLLAAIPVTQTTAQRVRAHLAAHLAGNESTLVATAAALHMSQRTLARRLAEDATSFKDLLDETRHSMALRYVDDANLALSEVGFLLGFSQASAFHRAFKRWTGTTPLGYRNRHLG